jgi:xylose isomerase
VCQDCSLSSPTLGILIDVARVWVHGPNQSMAEMHLVMTLAAAGECRTLADGRITALGNPYIQEGKTMREHLRFSVVYWHTFRGTGSDPFGAGTMLRPWDDGSTVSNAQNRVRAAFEFIEKLGAPYYAWHDRDVAPESKPKEPTKHQYDSDAAACLNFLREFDLLPHFKLNIEANHATLAGHTMQHELEVAGSTCALGSIDANTGLELLGWDTDQFPTNIYLAAHTMLGVLKYGGFQTGGVNFDAKVRRESFEPVDLFYAHIGGMDTFARGLKIAAAIRQDGRLAQFVKQRYASWDSGIGAKIESGTASLKEIEAHILKKGDVAKNVSGRQEFLENLINEFI